MKKVVNGKVVDIKNIELFEQAAEGLAIRNTTVSITSEGVEAQLDSPLIHNYIKQYDIFFRSMPYPLYAIESDIKYATLGNFLKAINHNKINMWVNNGLNIKLDDKTGMTLKIVNNTWAISYCNDIILDNTDMNLYKDSVGYNEYNWVLNKIIKKEKTNNFYNEFMPDFVRACNGQAMVLRWELNNILTFARVPDIMNFEDNKIIDLEDKSEYTLDIFCNGTTNTEEKITRIEIGNIDNLSNTRFKKIKTYDWNIYHKGTSDSASIKMDKRRFIGFDTLFNDIIVLKNNSGQIKFPIYKGVISDNNLIYSINGRLYITKVNRVTRSENIANGIELYSIEDDRIYFSKSKKINDKITKNILYSYNLMDKKARLCKIAYTY